jgi:DNA-binding CsgD family transcriptional regulator
MTSKQTTSSAATERGQRRGNLSTREREIVGMLADGMSGAEIAAKLFLSPETVRTHIRNAMAKLGASTRSQAVVLALQRDEIADDEGRRPAGGPARATAPRRGATRHSSPIYDEALANLLNGLCALHEIDGGLVLLAEEDGLTLRRVAVAVDNGSPAIEVPERLALGEGPLGRVALNRRASLLSSLAGESARHGSILAAPILANGRLLGVLGLTVRASRPTAQSELLILQALVNRVGEILGSGEDVDQRLETTVKRFVASWYAATG